MGGKKKHHAKHHKAEPQVPMDFATDAFAAGSVHAEEVAREVGAGSPAEGMSPAEVPSDDEKFHEAQTAIEPARVATPPLKEHPVTAVVDSLVSAASPYVSPLAARVKHSLPADVVQKLETAAASASVASHELLLHADEAMLSLRRTPDILKSKVGVIGEEVEKGAGLLKAKVAHLPEDIRELGAGRFATLQAAAEKLRASLPPSVEAAVHLAEEQLQKIRIAIVKVIEQLPKAPKVDLYSFQPAELVKLAHKLLDTVLPLLQPYQEKAMKLIEQYKVTERAALVHDRAAMLFKKYHLEKVAPKFVSDFISSGHVAPVVASQ